MLRKITAAAIVAASWSLSDPARGASHLWRFNEIFSNADGTVQFIELKECCGADGETFLDDKWVKSDATGKQLTFPANLTEGTANKCLLLATAQFAALPGAPTPDYIIPANFFSLTNPDTLRYWLYTDATMSFAAGAVPTDGINSRRINGTTGVNTPTNFAGDTGTVNAAPCIDGDSDGYGSPGSPQCPNGAAEDCNDGNGAINPGAAEACFDGIDNDCDGDLDCDDSTCASLLACIPTLSEWGLTIMALAAMAAGTIVLERRRRIRA